MNSIKYKNKLKWNKIFKIKYNNIKQTKIKFQNEMKKIKLKQINYKDKSIWKNFKIKNIIKT